jgi:hypothetical protein
MGEIQQRREREAIGDPPHIFAEHPCTLEERQQDGTGSKGLCTCNCTLFSIRIEGRKEGLTDSKTWK